MKTIKIRFDHFWEGFDYRSFFGFLSPHYDFEISDRPDFVIFSVFDGRTWAPPGSVPPAAGLFSVFKQGLGSQGASGYRMPRLKTSAVRIFYTGENITPDMRLCDYAFGFAHEETIANDRYLRLPIYATRMWKNGFHGRDLIKTDVDPDRVLAEKTRFCNFVYANSDAKFRIEFFDLLSKYKRVDAAGATRYNMGLPKRDMPTVADKLEFLRPYKFTIAFENESSPGYTTEKVAEPMLVNSLPIYWGNPEVHRDFNTRSFINYHDQGGTLEQMVELVEAVDNDDALYKRYVSEPYFHGNAISPYLDQERAINQFKRIFG